MKLCSQLWMLIVLLLNEAVVFVFCGECEPNYDNECDYCNCQEKNSDRCEVTDHYWCVHQQRRCRTAGCEDDCSMDCLMRDSLMGRIHRRMMCRSPAYACAMNSLTGLYQEYQSRWMDYFYGNQAQSADSGLSQLMPVMMGLLM